jgi:hypothetical protein
LFEKQSINGREFKDRLAALDKGPKAAYSNGEENLKKPEIAKAIQG